MAFTPEFIDDVRSRLSLSSIIGKRVKLIKKGRRYSGLCLFIMRKHPPSQSMMMKAIIVLAGALAMPLPICEKQRGLISQKLEQLAEMAGVPIPEQRAIDPVKLQKRQTVMDALGPPLTFTKANWPPARRMPHAPISMRRAARPPKPISK